MKNGLVKIHLWTWVLVLILVGTSIWAITHCDFDPPYGILTQSGTLFTDEGMHLKGANLALRTGEWLRPYDYDFRPSTPLLNVVAYLLFSLFGVSLFVARAYTVVVVAVGVLAFYHLLRGRFSPAQSLCITLGAACTLNYFGYARLFLIEPSATTFCLLSLVLYVRWPTKSWALPLSLLLATLAFFAKLHFAAFCLSLGLLWLGDAWSAKSPLWRTREFRWLALWTLVTFVSYALMVHALATTFAHFNETVRSYTLSSPSFMGFVDNYNRFFSRLVFNTKSPVPLGALGLGLLIFIVSIARTVGLGWSSWTKRFKEGVRENRDLAALALWLVMGWALMGALDYQPPRYFYFSILPLFFVATALLHAVLPKWVFPYALGILLASHLIYQAPLYATWWARSDRQSQLTMVQKSVELVTQDGEKRIHVMGQTAPLMALFSEQLFPIEVQNVPESQYSLCQRVRAFWPQWYVAVEPEDMRELPLLMECSEIVEIKEIARFNIFEGWRGDALLMRIRYRAGAKDFKESPESE